MAKYEKFEEWMVGKKVELEDGDRGVVIRSCEDGTDTVWVLRETSWAGETELWCDVSELTFLETQGCKPKSIPWEVGQEVWCLLRGKGVVNSVGVESVVIWFDRYGAHKYTSKGEPCGYEGVRSLFFSEPNVVAETMPPKKPFLPKLKEGDKVVAVNEEDSSKVYVFEVYQETEDSVAESYAVCLPKSCFKFFKLGEEIKFY